MKSPSDDIKDILETESSLGLTFAQNLFVGFEPDSPDTCVTIFDTPGMPPDLNYDKGEIYDRPSVQVRVRSKSYITAWNLISNIKRILHGKAHETWNGTYYSLIRCSIEPAILDWDNNGRVRLVTTFDIQRR